MNESHAVGIIRILFSFKQISSSTISGAEETALLQGSSFPCAAPSFGWHNFISVWQTCFFLNYFWSNEVCFCFFTIQCFLLLKMPTFNFNICSIFAKSLFFILPDIFHPLWLYHLVVMSLFWFHRHNSIFLWSFLKGFLFGASFRSFNPMNLVCLSVFYVNQCLAIIELCPWESSIPILHISLANFLLSSWNFIPIYSHPI